MKYRMVFVATGAVIGLCYLAAGVVVFKWLGASLYLIQIWTGLAALGAVVNALIALTWASEDETRATTSRLLFVQSYLPLAVAGMGMVCMCAPVVFLAVWTINAFLISPLRWACAMFVQHRLRRRMAAVGRCVSWNSLEPRLARGEGVLIVDGTQCRPGVVWWTADALAADAGLLVLPDERFARVAHDQLEKGVEILLPLSHFVASFLGEETGRAVLTPLGANFVESKKFLRAYPRVAIFAVDAQQGRTPVWARGARRSG